MLKVFLSISDNGIDGSKLHSQDLEPFQPEVTEDFPTIPGDEPRIPHIIHQTYKSTLIPNVFADNVKSFVEKNPKWTYYFWTDESARQLIKDKHPYLLDIWDNYQRPINRADALRYVVLYEFGGIYVDLDFESLRPLDRVTMKYACIFPTEPFEHSAFRIGIPYFINNAIMMCRPKHPFIKQMIDNLSRARVFLEQVDVAGPAFVTYNYLSYNNITNIYQLKTGNESNSPYFYKGELKEDDINAVYVPNTVYFMDTLDENHDSEKVYYETCRTFNIQRSLIRRACFELIRRGFHREKSPYTFTEHHWYQTYNNPITKGNFLKKLIKGPDFIDLSEIVPKYRMYPHKKVKKTIL